MNNIPDILIAFTMILMWLMGYWLHWWKTLHNKEKVYKELFNLALGNEMMAALDDKKDPAAQLMSNRRIGKANAYTHAVEIIQDNL
jgi:hypothetical protein